MILQALKEYYDRKAASLAPEGWEDRGFPFLIQIDRQGAFVRFEDTREGQGKSQTVKHCHVPSLGEKKGNGIKANLLWENIEYLLGIPVPIKNKPTPDAARVGLQHQAFIDRVMALPGTVEAIRAVQNFVKKVCREEVMKDPLWPAVLESNQPLAFSISTAGLLLEHPEVRDAVDKDRMGRDEGNEGLCLITGQTGTIARLEPPIKGVWGAQTMGANIVSVNNKNEGDSNAGATPAFASYGKQQAFNSPISKSAARAYTTALNYLLGKDSRQRMQVGDASTVFWSSRESLLEDQVADFFSEPPKDDPARNTKAVESLFKSVQSGALAKEEGATRFYVLGLAPNASRIAVRFWMVDTVPNMAARFCQHFEDLRIAHGPRDPETLSLFRLLVSTASLGKSENIPPNVAGDTMRAILEGRPYPQSLLQAAIRRIRAEHDISYARAALIKAYLNRAKRFAKSDDKEELKVSLDQNNMNVGYRLGRLFAALERIQIRKFTQHGGKEPNSTIRDRYYGSASGTPRSVFGTLIRLNKHHLAALENVGERINFEKLIGEIMGGISDFPAHLALEDQGRFAIGYYHQMQDFFMKKSETTLVKGE